MRRENTQTIKKTKNTPNRKSKHTKKKQTKRMNWINIKTLVRTKTKNIKLTVMRQQEDRMYSNPHANCATTSIWSYVHVSPQIFTSLQFTSFHFIPSFQFLPLFDALSSRFNSLDTFPFSYYSTQFHPISPNNNIK
jgi:hypothetical protein